MNEDTATLDKRLAVHEAVCAERYDALLRRLLRVEYLLYALIGLLAFGDGAAVDFVKRMLQH